jgi:hypothetical protein
MYAEIATEPATNHKPNEDFAIVIANGAVLLDGSDPNGTGLPGTPDTWAQPSPQGWAPRLKN